MTNPKTGLARRLQQMHTGDWLSRAIDTHSSFYSPEKWVEPNLEIHPSGAGSPCPRDIQLGMLGHRTEIKRQNRRRMDNGTAAHERWTTELKEIGVLASAGIRLKIPGEWSGEFDLLCQAEIGSTRHIGEIKTMNSNRYRRVPAQIPEYDVMAKILLKAESSYVYQLTQYLVKFKQFPGYTDISDDVFFLFENTDTQEYLVRWFRPSEEMKRTAFLNAEQAQKASQAGELIPPPFKRKSLTCTSKCYRELVCYREQDKDPEVLGHIENALYRTKHGLHDNKAENEARQPLVGEHLTPVALEVVEEESRYELIDWD